MSNLSLQLVSPDKDYFVGEIDMVVIPGEDGDFSVLPEHAPIITYLRPGKLIILEQNKKEHTYFVGSGFVKVEDNNCQVLVDYIKNSLDFDIKDSKKKLSELLSEIERESDEVRKQSLLEKKIILEEEINLIEINS
tara:strand:+ start:91 stop:498 length:408 start_codon:yes stop_codon:yes gene_type:complete